MGASHCHWEGFRFDVQACLLFYGTIQCQFQRVQRLYNIARSVGMRRRGAERDAALWPMPCGTGCQKMANEVIIARRSILVQMLPNGLSTNGRPQCGCIVPPVLSHHFRVKTTTISNVCTMFVTFLSVSSIARLHCLLRKTQLKYSAISDTRST